MRMRFVLGILSLCFMSFGCGPFSLATHTLIIEPIQYCQTADNILERRRDYKLAEEIWQTVAHANPKLPSSIDYENGFKDGFADYLYAGGTGEPPPLPPRQYWRITYETPEGHQAIGDWFAGFRLGAAVARESGYREWVTIPSSFRAPHADLHLSSSHIQSPAPPSDQNVLPPPKEIPAPQSPPPPSPSPPGGEGGVRGSPDNGK
jgi:hypothetical protein